MLIPHHEKTFELSCAVPLLIIRGCETLRVQYLVAMVMTLGRSSRTSQDCAVTCTKKHTTNHVTDNGQVRQSISGTLYSQLPQGVPPSLDKSGNPFSFCSVQLLDLFQKMSIPILAAFGTWKSPLSIDDLTHPRNVESPFLDLLVDRAACAIYHIEKRPHESGRNSLVQTETNQDLTSTEWDVRTSVNGYGGAPAVIHNNIAYFSHARDGRVYMMRGPFNRRPEPITPENRNHRFANFDVYPLDPTLLVCVMEDHTDATSPLEVVNSLCILNTKTKLVHPVESDASFYSSPIFSPDGKHIAWIEWDLPDMPWSGSELWVAEVAPIPNSDSLSLHNPRLIAGEHRKISIAYPSWVSSDILLFTSDISGFENPWVFDCTTSNSQAKPVLAVPVEESFGYGQPPRLGYSPYAVTDSPMVVFTAVRDGRSVLYLVNISTGSIEPLFCPFVEIHRIRSLKPNQFVFIGTKVDQSSTLIRCTLSPEPVYEDIVQPSSHGSTLPQDYVSLPQPISIQIDDSKLEIHIVYYPPTNPQYAAAGEERPPCVLNVHGGPVGFAAQSFNATKQFFTTRGWAWLDVNFGGTSGYGRAYRNRLMGNWGITDVDDCILAARSLSSSPYNLIDPKRIVIRGASGGGFAVLASFSFRAADTRGVFAAGTSLYGISDLRLLQKDTHKYESRYLEMLIGDDSDTVLLDSRSAIRHVDKIEVPLLILQGDADTAVPKAQAEGIVESIQKRGGTVEYMLYSGEGHGWKQKDTIQDAILREWRFYNRVLGIQAEE
ncbi:Peptidase-S9 domain-containing protein [Mycena indigotica]|uniref:Peptidase-S9 domain-containing protein n=1 Tax=Mycena indigotica TaxID=2126181 RepID=A0A8H6RZG6_9AGAR|nr:Peptidase-S9 domain-containing protein [Mycena indigotica]KAF7290555.1 Peptidase-S9 domain-containing protein [Mycena indigotica]